MASRKALTTDEWCYAALEQIAAGGTESVSVEGLARQLGVTKGSFYWHFADRSALIAAALDYWAEAATERVIQELSAITDPHERLSALFRTTFSDDRSPLDVMLATSIDDPVVAAVVERVTRTRLDFLKAGCRELGLSEATAERQALIAYAAYIGHFQLTRALGPDASQRYMGTPYLEQFLETLLPMPPSTVDATDGEVRDRVDAEP